MLTLVKVYQPSEGLEKWFWFQMHEGKFRARPGKGESLRLEVSTRGHFRPKSKCVASQSTCEEQGAQDLACQGLKWIHMSR